MSLSIDDFFGELDKHPESVPLGELVDLMKQLDLSPQDVEEHLNFSDEKYLRNLWRCGRGYSALLLCWCSGQDTPIHNHQGSACGVLVVQGKVTENIYIKNEDGSLKLHVTNEYKPGFVCGSYDADIHDIANLQNEGERMVTLHIYTPALTDYHVFQMDGSSKIFTDSTMDQQKKMLSMAT